MLAELLEVLPDNRDELRFVSVGGTITLLAALLAGISEYRREAVSGRIVSVTDLQALKAEMQPLTPAARLQKYPLLLGREDIIICGIDIYLTLAELTGSKEFVASDAGLLDGLLLSRL
jgi:exopolyphosphatase/pppGpp-phosphohydrolase